MVVTMIKITCILPKHKKAQKLIFQVKEGSERCVSWDFSSNNWVTDGCITVKNNTSGIIECHCTHLTNFAILVVS